MTWDRQTIAAAVPVGAVAVVAGVVSFSHIEALALAQHQTISQARLLPLAVDGLIAAGSVILLAGYWLGWLGVVIGVSATVFANVESGLPYGPLSATVAAWPAIAFTVASLILERWLKRQVSSASQAAAKVVTEPRADGTEPAADEPALDQAEPPVVTCGHGVAGTAEENVVRAYLHERDCLGVEPRSQRKLAADFGVSRPKVSQLVGSLNGHGRP